MSQWTDQSSGPNQQVAASFCLPFLADGRRGNTVASRLDYAGRAVERNLNLAERGEERLAERTRIARELHDTLLQGFFAASMQLHAAVDQLPADCAAAKPRFHDVLEVLDRVLERGRSAVQGLRSSPEPISSLGEAFAGVPYDLGVSSSAGFRVVVQGRERELSAALRDEIYCIGCEAIVNAFRHSGATKIEMEIEYRPTELRITVRDNGCGINPQQLQWGRNEHWGLQWMRERTEKLGGRLRLLSRVHLGTEVQLSVPAVPASTRG